MPSLAESKCILVTGGTSGIGRAFAIAIKNLPSKPKVIVLGRRQERLDEMEKEHGIHGINFDMDADRNTLKTFVEKLIQDHPDLDSVLFSAGIQRVLPFDKPEEMDIIGKFEREINTNFMSIVVMCGLLLPHLLKLGRPSFLIPVSSGLATVPAPWMPGYCSSKAALHSFCTSLHIQLKSTNVHVMEILPPLVESELHDEEGTTAQLSKMWMPLDKYIPATMEGLLAGKPEIPVLNTYWDKFEAGKFEAAEAMWDRLNALQAKLASEAKA